MDAFKDACLAGIQPLDFWTLTPFQTRLWCQQYTERERAAYKLATFTAWHTAVFSRQKKIPDLIKVLNGFDRKKDVKRKSPGALLALVRQINVQLGGKEKPRG